MQPMPTASYSLTLRVRLSSRAGSLGELTTAIGRAGGRSRRTPSPSSQTELRCLVLATSVQPPRCL